MPLQRIRTLLKENWIFYLTGAAFVLGLKLFYSQADADELKWILAPTSRWVSILSGIPFEYMAHTGFVNHDIRFIIASSCSGIQFMLIAAATDFLFRTPRRRCRRDGTYGSGHTLDCFQRCICLPFHDPCQRTAHCAVHLHSRSIGDAGTCLGMADPQ